MSDSSKVYVDVQHIGKPWPNQGDQGARFELPTGAHVYESDLATTYAGGVVAALVQAGVTVKLNDPQLRHSYRERNHLAIAWGADVYLACHVNAGGGDFCQLECREPDSRGRDLGLALGLALADAFPALHSYHVTPIHPGLRGWVCIGSCAPETAALIVEPFFGDRIGHRPLMQPAALWALGVTIGAATARWLGTANPA